MYGTHLILLTDVVVRALGQGAPKGAIAGHYGKTFRASCSSATIRERDAVHPAEAGGGRWGTPAASGGENAMFFVADGDTRNICAEVLDSRFPLRLERHELRQDSGGAGARRGGLGIYREYRIVGHDAHLTCIMDRATCPLWASRVEACRARSGRRHHPRGSSRDAHEGDARARR